MDDCVAPETAQLAEFVAAIDQGTTSTRCMIFDHDGGWPRSARRCPPFLICERL